MENFWKKQAEEYREDVRAVNFDPIAEDIEIHFLKDLIKDQGDICDIGCGNGRTLLELASEKKSANFYGIDFIEKMIEVAREQQKKAGLKNLKFFIGDAASRGLKDITLTKFDTVITKRLLINMMGPKKIAAVKNIHSMLKKNGLYLMVECFVEPLKEINEIRRMLNLEEIKVKHFNEYLDLKFMKSIESIFRIKEVIDFGSLYYLTSRVYNAYLSNGKPDYHAKINELSAFIVKNRKINITGYSPEIIYILEKR